MDTLRVKRFSEDAILPTRSHPTDAGLDLYSPIDATIHAFDFVRIDLGVGIALFKGTVGLILDRSSMGSKGIGHLAGVIDANYRGSITVILTNAFNPSAYQIKRGDKIAQMIITPVYTPEVIEVSEFETTDRNDNGFGSTGR